MRVIVRTICAELRRHWTSAEEMDTVPPMHSYCSPDQLNPMAFPKAGSSAIPSRKLALLPSESLLVPEGKKLAKVGVEGSNPFARSK
jgi:hypothetical protein